MLHFLELRQVNAKGIVPKNYRGRKVATGPSNTSLASPYCKLVDKQSVVSMMNKRKGHLVQQCNKTRRVYLSEKESFVIRAVQRRRHNKNSHSIGEKKSFNHLWLSLDAVILIAEYLIHSVFLCVL